MKFAFRGVSGAALMIGLSGGLHAWAQQAPAAPQGQTVATSQQAAPQTPAEPSSVDQTQPAAAGQDDRVVVTGSLLITAPEDAPKPVESYNYQELRETGAPSVAEFVRDLSINYDSSLYGGNDSGVGGDNKANLRGLGDTATMVLLNGRRLTTDNGFGADLSTIPENALAAVDVLKDGASTTYGAGAVAGVINYRTRRDIDSPEIQIEKRFYDGSDGEYTIDFQTGWVGDAGNLLFTYSYEHSDALKQTERDFSSLPFGVNPEAYTLNSGNPGSYLLLPQFYSAAPTAGFDTPGGTTAAGHLNANRLIQDYGSAANCTTIGGQLRQDLRPFERVSTATTRLNQSCSLPAYLFQDLVDEAEQHQAYAELNFDISETMAIQVSGLYSTSLTTNRGSPSAVPTNGATVGYTYGGALAAQDDTTCAGACNFVIPVAVQTFTAAGTPTGTFVRNPFIDNFIARSGANPAGFTNGTALFTGPGWRPFLFGGNGITDSGLAEGTDQTERLIVAAELTGQFAGDGWASFLNGINYKQSIQLNQQIRTGKDNNILVSRLHNALLGYGGPNCQAQDRVVTNYSAIDPAPGSNTAANSALRQAFRHRYNNTVGIQSDTAPGTNGCQFFNPFMSSFATSIANGATNPAYGGTSFENSRELMEWLFHQRQDETERKSLSMDSFYSGTIPESFFALPGGEIGWGAGLHWRMTELRNQPGVSTDDNDFELQRCAFPDPQHDVSGQTRKPISINTLTGTVTVLEPDEFQGSINCTDLGNGPGAFTTGTPNLPTFTDEQTFSMYAEVQLPILDTLNGSLSWRRESFNDRRIEGDIYNAALKWDITDNIYVRGSYGTNFRAVAELNETPGRIEVIDRFILGRFANTPIIRTQEIDTDLQPEEDTTLNIGVGYQAPDFFGGRLRASVDFWEIVITGEVVGGAGTAGLTSALERTFTRNADGTGGIPVTATEFDASFAQCSSPVIILWEFGTGTCQQGVTQGSDTLVFKSLTTNSAGFVTNGIDYALNYSMPFLSGDLSFDLRATQTLNYKDKGFTQFGVVIEEAADLLGLSSGGLNQGESREFRGNLTTRWSNDDHSVSFRINYDSGLKDKGYLACLPPYFDTATNTQITEAGAVACGNSLEAVYYSPTTGQALPGAAAFSRYGFDAGDRTTYDITYIYKMPFWEELELRASVLNITDVDPFPQQGASGYVTGDPRGRIFELEVTKKF